MAGLSRLAGIKPKNAAGVSTLTGLQPVATATRSRSSIRTKDADLKYHKFCFTDIDHTFSNAAWRDAQLGDWDEYHRLSVDDKPIPETVALLASLNSDRWWTIGLTARPEKWRAITINWCIKHGVFLDELIMRPNDNYQGAAEFKRQEVINRLSGLQKTPTVILFDDRDDVISAIKESGVRCALFQVNIGGVGG